MRLRRHLLLMTLATLLPMLVFGVAATLLIANREQAVFRSGATERTLAVLTAVDTGLSGYLAALEGLANSPGLARGDLGALKAEAGRMLDLRPNWRGVTLTSADGRRLMRMTKASVHGAANGSAGSPSPPTAPDGTEDESLEAVLRTGMPAVGGVRLEDGLHHFSVRAPVRADGVTTAVLSAQIDPQAILELLRLQELPADWVGVVLDAEHDIVARTVAHDRFVGRKASDSLRAAVDRSSADWFRGETLEGSSVYAPFNRSSDSSWTVAMGIPVAVVTDGMSRTIWLLAAGILAAMGLAMLLAAGLARRIQDPMTALASVARAIGSGRPLNARLASWRVDEVNEVRDVLVSAGETVRKREQDLRAADRAKDELLDMLAHELRNPLSAMWSSVQVLQLASTDERAAKIASDVLERQTQHMARLVDDLLEVTRATSGRLVLNRKPVDLGELVTGYVDTARSAHRLEQHAVVVSCASVWADVDPARVEQILSNLLTNALKFTPDGGSIEIATSWQDCEAVIEVSDAGIGLDDELAPRVFDLFVQGKQSLDRRLGGLGIGLTLVKRLTEIQGGRVSSASEGAGRGSRFTVRFPAIDPPAQPSADDAPPAVSKGAGTVLLVEDNDDARLTLAAALALYGFDVAEAADGESALEAAAEIEHDAVIVDIGLPGLDGYEVAGRLRQTAAGARTALIALTGYGDTASRRRAIEAGFDAYFTKPASPAAIAEYIANARGGGNGGPQPAEA